MSKQSQQQLQVLDRQLSDRDKSILRSLQTCRCLTTRQIQRLHFVEHASAIAALKATNRCLGKLQKYGLIVILKQRRIGGAQSGSGSNIWLLTETGDRLLRLGIADGMQHKRFFNPSPTFLEHTLTVAETYLQLTEICRRHRMELLTAELEPACWRGYRDETGKPAYLKPDLYAVTVSGEYEDSWFIEVDLATESMNAILEKCRRYAYYHKLGIEQKRSGIFPLVVWIVPSVARKVSLQQYITNSRELQSKSIFLVITPDQLETLICQGVGEGGL